MQEDVFAIMSEQGCFIHSELVWESLSGKELIQLKLISRVQIIYTCFKTNSV